MESASETNPVLLHLIASLLPEEGNGSPYLHNTTVQLEFICYKPYVSDSKPFSPWASYSKYQTLCGPLRFPVMQFLRSSGPSLEHCYRTCIIRPSIIRNSAEPTLFLIPMSVGLCIRASIIRHSFPFPTGVGLCRFYCEL